MLLFRNNVSMVLQRFARNAIIDHHSYHLEVVQKALKHQKFCLSILTKQLQLIFGLRV